MSYKNDDDPYTFSMNIQFNGLQMINVEIESSEESAIIVARHLLREFTSQTCGADEAAAIVEKMKSTVD